MCIQAAQQLWDRRGFCPGLDPKLAWEQQTKWETERSFELNNLKVRKDAMLVIAVLAFWLMKQAALRLYVCWST